MEKEIVGGGRGGVVGDVEVEVEEEGGGGGGLERKNICSKRKKTVF